MQRIVVNVMTGEQTVVELTPEEIASLPPPAPPAPSPVPNLTFPQLLFGLVTEGFISEAEANDWLVNRVLPAPIEAQISQLPGPQKILARARALQPTEIIFTDPMVQGLGGTEQFFRTYAQV